MLDQLTIESFQPHVGTTFWAEFPNGAKVELDFDPQSDLLLMRNEDRPGIIGLVGSHLGAAGINIVNFSLGAKGDGEALAAITVDRPVPEPQLVALRGITGVLSLEAL